MSYFKDIITIAIGLIVVSLICFLAGTSVAVHNNYAPSALLCSSRPMPLLADRITYEGNNIFILQNKDHPKATFIKGAGVTCFLLEQSEFQTTPAPPQAPAI